jgi:hypothetical protein
VQQCARFSRIARHALTEDLVSTKRTRKLDAMPRPEEIQQAPVALVDGGVDHVEGDEPEPAWHLPDADVMELVAAALGSPDPDNRAVLRDAIQRPRRSVKLSAIPLTCGERTVCVRALALLLQPRTVGERAGGHKRQGGCDDRQQDGRLHPSPLTYVVAEGFRHCAMSAVLF